MYVYTYVHIYVCMYFCQDWFVKKSVIILPFMLAQRNSLKSWRWGGEATNGKLGALFESEKTAQFSHLHWNRRWGRSHCFISQSERDTAIVCKWKGACVIVIVFITRRATECEMLVLSLPRWMAQRNEKSDKTRKQIESTKAEYSARNRNW